MLLLLLNHCCCCCCRYFLSIGGADSAALVWLNGAFVGACKDSRLPSDWEVTQLLQPTGNLLAVQVRGVGASSNSSSSISSSSSSAAAVAAAAA
jgi:beta-galactosidase/beta-glucuronidase